MTLPRPWAMLAASLIANTVLFGLTADYPPALHDGIVALLLLASAATAWFAAARTLAGEGVGDALRLRTVAALLLIAPFALFSLLLGVGPPHMQQPAQENDLRFLLLAIAAMLVGGGLMVLKEALAAAGERVYAGVGFAAIVLASPLYVAFALIQRIDYVAVELGYSWAGTVDGTKPELTPLDAFSIAVLYFGGVLTYIATASFAQALFRAGWLGRGATTTLQAISAVGLAFLVMRGFAYPSPRAAFSHWYTIPGFIAGIPAVPWMPLCAMGVLLLRRGDRERAAVASINAPARRAAPSTPT